MIPSEEDADAIFDKLHKSLANEILQRLIGVQKEVVLVNMNFVRDDMGVDNATFAKLFESIDPDKFPSEFMDTVRYIKANIKFRLEYTHIDVTEYLDIRQMLMDCNWECDVADVCNSTDRRVRARYIIGICRTATINNDGLMMEYLTTVLPETIDSLMIDDSDIDAIREINTVEDFLNL